MGILLLAALIGVPLIEIGVFIQVGGLIGLWPTLVLIVLTAVFGSWQLRAQDPNTVGQLDHFFLAGFFGLVLAEGILVAPLFVARPLAQYAAQPQDQKGRDGREDDDIEELKTVTHRFYPKVPCVRETAWSGGRRPGE